MKTENTNIFFYTNDNTQQSKRQLIPLMTSLEQEGFNIFCNNPWGEKVLGNIIGMPLEKYLEEHSLVKTFFFVFNAFEVKKISKQLKNKKNCIIIYRPRGILPEESFYRRGSYIRKKALDYIETKAMKLADYYCFITYSQRLHFASKYYNIKNVFSRSIVVHNYLLCEDKKTEFEYEKNKEKNDKLKLVYSGGFSKWQKIDDVFKLVKDIYLKYKSIEFNIYTFEKNNEKANELIEKYQLQEIAKISNLKMDEVDYHMRYNDVGIILRDDSLVNITASPFKIADYLGANVGLIMTDNIGDYKEVLKDKPYVYFANTNTKGEICYNSDEIVKFLKYIKEQDIKKVISKDVEVFFNMKDEIKKLKKFINEIS